MKEKTCDVGRSEVQPPVDAIVAEVGLPSPAKTAAATCCPTNPPNADHGPIAALEIEHRGNLSLLFSSQIIPIILLTPSFARQMI